MEEKSQAVKARFVIDIKNLDILSRYNKMMSRKSDILVVQDFPGQDQISCEHEVS